LDRPSCSLASVVGQTPSVQWIAASNAYEVLKVLVLVCSSFIRQAMRGSCTQSLSQCKKLQREDNLVCQPIGGSVLRKAGPTWKVLHAIGQGPSSDSSTAWTWARFTSCISRDRPTQHKKEHPLPSNTRCTVSALPAYCLSRRNSANPALRLDSWTWSGCAAVWMPEASRTQQGENTSKRFSILESSNYFWT
jgi:hypothetical protein